MVQLICQAHESFSRSSHSGFDNSIQVVAEGGEDLFQSYLNENGVGRLQCRYRALTPK